MVAGPGPVFGPIELSGRDDAQSAQAVQEEVVDASGDGDGDVEGEEDDDVCSRTSV